MYHFFSAICTVLLCAIALGYVIAIFQKVRSKRTDFVRQFKKGKCVIVYFIAIPLYFMGHIYAGQEGLPAFFTAINKTMTLVVLRYDISTISGLMADNRTYTVAVYVCFFLVAFNAMLFAVSVCWQKLCELFYKKSWDWSRKERVLIVGNNEDNVDIYSSVKKRAVILLDDIPEKDRAKLYAKNIHFLSLSGDVEDVRQKKGEEERDPDTAIDKYCCKLVCSRLPKLKKNGKPAHKRAFKLKQPCIIIINTKDDYKNIALCQKIVAAASQHIDTNNKTEMAEILSRIIIYVFGMPDHEAIYNSIVESAHGCIRYINKYRQIAMDFVERYPLTQFMTDEQIDYETSLLKDGVDVNVAMIGFGKTNRQIFLTSVANNQFLVQENGEKVLKPVNYHIFDKQPAVNNKNLNHSYYRFKNEFEDQFAEQSQMGSAHPYLPFPMLPAEEKYDKLDVNDPAFYKELRAALSGNQKFNYIVIAYGTDLENIDMAQKMLEKKQEWDWKNTYVFVKVRSGNDSYAIFQRNDCFLIGDEPKTVYSIDQIDDHVITKMAKMRNQIYAIERKRKEEINKLEKTSPEDVRKAANCDWYINKTQFERESNVYACLSLRSKLHLMGLDYIADSIDDSRVVIDEDTYLKHRYAEGDEPQRPGKEEIDGKKIVEYTLDFKESRRKTMAIHEHLRWNSFMITKGFVPSSKQEILDGKGPDGKNNNGKNYPLRKHGNLTTFEGLEEFRSLVAKRDKVAEIETDVIKYDYQLLDDAYWLLTKNQYKIVERQSK